MFRRFFSLYVHKHTITKTICYGYYAHSVQTTLLHVGGSVTSTSAGNAQKGTGSNTGSNGNNGYTKGKSRNKLINKYEVVLSILDDFTINIWDMRSVHWP